MSRAIDVSDVAARLRRINAERPDNAWKTALDLIAPLLRNPGDDVITSDDVFDSTVDRHVIRSVMDEFMQRCPPMIRVLVVAGGSGSGKSTLTRLLLGRHSDKFVWVRRSTTRPIRVKDLTEQGMHRFMSTTDFQESRSSIYGVTAPYGYQYGFLLDDIITAISSSRTWVTNVMIDRTDLGLRWPQMKVRTLGVTPVDLPSCSSEGAQRMREVFSERISKRDDMISEEELNARVRKASQDTVLLCRIADRVVLNAIGTPLELAYLQFERAALELSR